jgi:oxaloacetate decarboxylase (Na+ extruding) subunit alpha
MGAADVSEINFVDTTVRDGNQSLWASGIRTSEMLPALRNLDDAGFEAIEIHTPAIDKKMVRELLEDPFERLRLARERAPKTPLRIIRGRSLESFQLSPECIEKLWCEQMAAIGISEFRTSDSSHTVAHWRRHIEMAREVGINTVVNLIFSISPLHTDEYYAEKAKELVKLKPYRICLKDPGALFTPERVQTLVPKILEQTKGIDVEFHTHCHTGLGGLCTIEAIKLGITKVNTAIPPLADGSGNPSAFEVAKNARVLGYETNLDEDKLRLVESHFDEVVARAGYPVGSPMPYDAAHYIHQVPGGMISNLRFQLEKAGIGEKLPEVLEEIGRVRAEFGYPIMVTPYSQFVGSQAVMNILSGERYATVSDEIIAYTLGYWGAHERDAIDPDVRDRILDRPRARKLAQNPPQEPSLNEIRRVYGGNGVSDEEMLLRIFTGEASVNAMRAANTSHDGAPPTNSITELIEYLSTEDRVGFFAIQKSGLNLVLNKPAKSADADIS